MEKAEVFHGRQTPHRAADDVFHSPLDKASDAPSPLRPFVIHQTMTNKLAIRNGRWKLLDHRDSGGNDYVSNPMLRKYHLPDTDPEAPGQLYDLGTDPGETQNVYSKHPDVVAHLKGQLEQAKQSGRSVTRRDE